MRKEKLKIKNDFFLINVVRTIQLVKSLIQNPTWLNFWKKR